MEQRSNPKAVFIVEDDEGMREAIEQLLSVAGFKTAVFGSAEALLNEAVTESPLCVISDLNLPAMSGLQLLTVLGQRSEQPPVIVITAFDSAATREQATRLGAAAYLAKPFTSNALLTAIDAIAARVN
jgi:FixJ family two-component response regulator